VYLFGLAPLLLTLAYQGQPTPMKKFIESCWKCFLYSTATVVGVWCLWDKPWFFVPEAYWVRQCVCVRVLFDA
jgi:hypothetical protein